MWVPRAARPNISILGPGNSLGRLLLLLRYYDTHFDTSTGFILISFSKNSHLLSSTLMFSLCTEAVERYQFPRDLSSLRPGEAIRSASGESGWGRSLKKKHWWVLRVTSNIIKLNHSEHVDSIQVLSSLFNSMYIHTVLCTICAFVPFVHFSHCLFYSLDSFCSRINFLRPTLALTPRQRCSIK